MNNQLISEVIWRQNKGRADTFNLLMLEVWSVAESVQIKDGAQVGALERKAAELEVSLCCWVLVKHALDKQLPAWQPG